MTDTLDRHLAPSPGAKKPAIAYSMRALGRRNLPDALAADGRNWRHVRTIKHDFWAVTGFYEDGRGERAVLRWVGPSPLPACRWNSSGAGYVGARCVYTRLSDLPNVPPVLGLVGATGFLHAYVEGEPLAKDRPVPDTFFADLLGLMQQLHRRDIAYVDANKPQNILVGVDQKPHLIDFQISGICSSFRAPG